MWIESKHLGRFEVEDQQVFRFPQGLLGFEDLERFVFVDSPTLQPFRWMVSLEDRAVHFAVAPPACFFEGPYLITLSEADAEVLDLDRDDRLTVHILVSPAPHGSVTGNMKGPVVLNVRNGIAKQLLVYGARFSIHQPVRADAHGAPGRIAQTTVRLAGRRVA